MGLLDGLLGHGSDAAPEAVQVPEPARDHAHSH